ncbi:hypothetical protein HanRHA438_Chr13g0606291 [Helianthus annuus]|nr:hypothetical protein HanRHA438_Chr13g0606291 [Helianthus annuus]
MKIEVKRKISINTLQSSIYIQTRKDKHFIFTTTNYMINTRSLKFKDSKRSAMRVITCLSFIYTI